MTSLGFQPPSTSRTVEVEQSARRANASWERSSSNRLAFTFEPAADNSLALSTMSRSSGQEAGREDRGGQSPQMASRNLIAEAIESILSHVTGTPAEWRHGFSTAAVSAWTGWSVDKTDAHLDAPLAVAELLDAGHLAKADRLRSKAGSDLDRIIAEGLKLREGRLLVQAPVLTPDMCLDGVVHDWLRFIREKVHPTPGDPIPGAPCVCQGCTQVFRPLGRKKRAAFCNLCAKRPPAQNVLGYEPISTFDLTGKAASSPLSSRLHLPTRVPVVEGSEITGWRTVRLPKCAECGNRFLSKKVNGRYCSAPCRKRAARRRLASGFQD